MRRNTSKLDSESDTELREFPHMGEWELRVIGSILSTVNVVIRILESAFDPDLVRSTPAQLEAGRQLTQMQIDTLLSWN